MVEGQRGCFRSGDTLAEERRRARLEALRSAIEGREEEVLAALAADLGKERTEAWVSEVAPVLAEIRHAVRHLGAWMGPRRARVPFLAWPGRARVSREPHGVALILGPWNYPFQLLLMPLVGALAAGNAAVLKPSEFAPHTAAVCAAIVGEAFPDGVVSVVQGGREVAEALLRERFDFIFFTGGGSAGRAVMAAAARHLTPVVLELGGKCPAIICADACRAALDTVARRLVWGKFLNAGQTCVAPDHLWVEREAHDRLVAAMCRAVEEFYGSAQNCGRIVNRRHFERVTAYLAEGTAACGGRHDVERLWIAPTILTGVSPEAPVMREEIFGPVLPVLSWQRLDDVLAAVNEMPPPLAVYLFSRDRRVQRTAIGRTRSGGVCVNDTVVQITGHDLPFGGSGESGMGRYHGKASFDCFTQERVIMRRPLFPDPGFRYPPPKLPLRRLRRWFRLWGGA